MKQVHLLTTFNSIDFCSIHKGK